MSSARLSSLEEDADDRECVSATSLSLEAAAAASSSSRQKTDPSSELDDSERSSVSLTPIFLLTTG